MIDTMTISSNTRRLGKRLCRFSFPVFEMEARGYFIITMFLGSLYEGTITISDKSAEFESLHNCAEIGKDGSLRILTNRNLKDKSFYTEKIKEVLEYLSEPRWIIALNGMKK